MSDVRVPRGPVSRAWLPDGLPRPRPGASRATAVAVAAAGTLASAVVAVCGTPLSSHRPSRLTALVAGSPHVAGHPLLLPRLTAAASATLIVCFVLALRSAAVGELRERGVWRLFALWGLPLVVGAPLLSADVYAYIADAHQLAQGHDPYAAGATALGGDPVLGALDPRWAGAPAPYGPVALLLLRGVAAGGVAASATWLVLVATAAVVATGLLLRRLVDPPRRPFVLALWLLAPPVLLHLVGGGHLDAVMIALVVAAFTLARRHPTAAVGVAALAAGVKAPAALGVAVLCVTGLPTPARARVAALAGRIVVAAGAYAAPALLLPDPLGIRHGLSSPATSRTLGAPVTLAWRGLAATRHVMSWLPAPSLGQSRLVALVVAAGVGGWLVVTHARRPPLRTTGLALLVTVALAPVCYPWYAGWPLACLAPTVQPQRRRLAVGTVILATLPGLPGLDRLGARGAALVATAALVVLAVAWRWTCDEALPAPP